MSLKKQAIQTALQGDWTQAILLNKNLVKENPQDLDALNRLALAYIITGKLKEAKSTYQKVVNIDPLNSIAVRNLKKLKEKNIKSAAPIKYQINNKFLEEPGKTKVIELINIAQPKVVEALRTGQSLQLLVKRLKIFVEDENQYIGVLPDDIAKRLIKFIKGGCVYESYVKSANLHKVSIFIKEIKKPVRLKDQPSFLSNSESSLVVSKSARKSFDKDDDENEVYPEE
jgi:tetratricopeptide (TPR) repeat protein